MVGNGSLAGQGGSATGCDIPGFSNGIALQAVALNIIAVSPTGPGHVAAAAADQPLVRSFLNYSAGLNIANTGPVAVRQGPGTGDFTILSAISSTHIVISVVGYYSKPVQTVHVHPVPGDPTASGTALLNRLAGISNASATKRYVIKIEPGIYDLGSAELVMKPFVDIEGSGQEATVIQAAGNNAGEADTGVIEGAASAELRDLQVKSIGSSSQTNAIAFYAPQNTDTRLRRVTLVASGALANRGIRAAGGSPVIEDCTIQVQGTAFNYGLAGLGTSRPALKRTLIEVTNGGGESYGMFLSVGAAPAEARDVQIRVSGVGSLSYGIYVDAAASGVPVRLTSSTIDVIGSNTVGLWFNGNQLNVEHSQIRASGSNSVGVRATAGNSAVIDHSEIAGATNTADGFNVFIGATRLHGGPVAAIPAKCAGVYDESFTFTAGPTCP